MIHKYFNVYILNEWQYQIPQINHKIGALKPCTVYVFAFVKKYVLIKIRIKIVLEPVLNDG